MKLKQDCVRYVLLNLEAQKIELTFNGASADQICSVLANDKFSEDDIYYTLYQLWDGKFIDATVTKVKLGHWPMTVRSLTWKGHELLDNIRDDVVWKKTKEATKSFSSVSLNILSSVAANVLTGLVKQASGLNF